MREISLQKYKAGLRDYYDLDLPSVGLFWNIPCRCVSIPIGRSRTDKALSFLAGLVFGGLIIIVSIRVLKRFFLTYDAT